MNPYDAHDDHSAPITIAPGNPYKAPSDAADLKNKGLESQIKALEIERKRRELANMPAPVADVSASDLSGQQYLSTLDKPTASLVKALAEGRKAFPAGAALRAPYWQQMLTHVSNYDPGFDEVNYTSRAATRKDFTSGKAANNIRALNTAIGHLGHLSEQVDGTASHGGFPFATSVNAAENAYKRSSGDAGPTNFDATVSALAGELTAVYRGAGGAEADIQRYIEQMSPNASKEQKVGTIRNIVGLLKSRLDALNDQYRQGMGTTAQNLQLLDPEAQKVVKTLGGFDAAGAPQGGFADYSAMTGDTNEASATDPNARFRQEPNADANALMAGMVRKGVPYRKALSEFRSRFPEISPFSPAEYGKAQSYAKSHPDYKGGFSNAIKFVPLSETEQGKNANTQSTAGAFLGHLGNAGAFGLPSLLAGDQGDFWRANSGAQHPTASLFGDIGGAITGSTVAGKALGLAGLSAPKAAVLGDLGYGGTFGATQNPEHPILGAATGMAASAAGNAVGRYTLGPGLRVLAETRPGQAAINGVANGMSRLIAKKGTGGGFNFNPPPAPTGGQSLLLNQTGKAGMDDVRNTLTEAADLNLPYSLADSHPRLTALAGSITRKGPNARTLAENTFGPRQLGQGERAIGAIDTHLAQSGDIGELQAAATQRARTNSAPLYENAKSLGAPDDAQLNALLNTPAGSQASRKAYDIALNSGENPAEMSFSLDLDGNPVLTANPNWKTLHYVRQGLDSTLENARDPHTGQLNLKDPATRGLVDLRQSLSSRIHALNPDFAKADAEFAKYAGQGSAIGQGAKATSPRVSSQAVDGVLGDMPADRLPFYQQGYASSMADTVDNARYSSNPYGMIYGTPAQRAKVGSIFPQGADKFGRVNALEGDMSKTAYETLGGSPTALRQEADKAFEGNHLAGDALELGVSAATGAPPMGILRRMGGQKLSDTLRVGFGKSAARRADEIAPDLFNTDPRAGLKLLDEMAKMKAQRDAFEQSFRRLGGGILGPVGLGITSSR